MKSVLITGCSTGIGRALAIEFHERGCRVLATARKVEAIEDLKALGMTTAAVDVTQPSSLKAAIASFGGHVDIVVANAGMAGFSPLVEADLSTVQGIFQTNVVGVIATVQAATPSMMERGSGLVVVIGSVSGVLVTPYAGAYCASKAAVAACCTSFRMELEPFGIGVLHVMTGAVRSQFADNAIAESSLPVDSRYAVLQPYIEARTVASQGPQSMEAAAYARDVVHAALAETVPDELVAGGSARKYLWTGKFTPAAMLKASLQKTFGLDTLQTAATRKASTSGGFCGLFSSVSSDAGSSDAGSEAEN
ncbi:unnamed protein product [Polarella glacialis]|uniref:Ketoreductase domain-containing protein n=1 Tax=Polarella glacialis TaxID=89957 RepID=A0A813JVE4_POLGL|nr:unnamed protein product [Polarella glacialis]|eukprot:CAMPEP_0115060496 /NCGR_PEP_ID=MMETSP0227-20121206/7494_1 /TAXON_ID=89957 /ORGANISM="Polarella glacialis, Strain CCMP 1383" /LENGTH=306 /DNA_ID=CAMNT_0002445713 /DNA_START=59 /DNA_END=979 /DNA_ORIENTATION=-